MRDEADCLADCLASVRDVCDEIVIVDTGSVDETVSIARSFGANVIEIEWRHHFAEARNVGLDAATGEWILQLDADETLAPGRAPALLECLTATGCAGWNVPIESALPSGGTALHYYPRLFRRDESVRYVGRIHERPTLTGPIERAAFTILHSGYDVDSAAISRKQDRNLPLLERWLEDEPSNPEPLFHKTTALLAARRYEDATPVARSTAYAFAALGEPARGHQAAAWNLLGVAQAGRGQWSLAKQSHQRALSLEPNLVDAHFDLAICCESCHEYDAALQHYARYHIARRRWLASKRTDLMLRTVASENVVLHNTKLIESKIAALQG